MKRQTAFDWRVPVRSSLEWISRQNRLKPIELSMIITEVSGGFSMRDDPSWTRKNSLKLIELSSINKVTLF